MTNKNDLLNELINKQRKDVYYSYKLSYRDLNRITKYIKCSIFGDKCCLWDGYVSTSQKETSYYINFFFKNKKTSLQKLLYQNYIGNIDSGEYIKYTCENGGKCCNTNHFIKYVPESGKINNINNDDSDESSESSDLTESDKSSNEEDFIVRF